MPSARPLSPASQSARDDLERRLQALEAQAKAAESELRQRLQALATTQAAAEGALTAERAARLERQREVEILRVRLDEAMAGKEGDAELRAAIAKLGRDFVAGRDLKIPGAFPFVGASALSGRTAAVRRSAEKVSRATFSTPLPYCSFVAGRRKAATDQRQRRKVLE